MNIFNAFEYRDGALFWKERTEDEFKNPSYCSRWNKRWAGKRAGNQVKRKDSATSYRCICFKGKKYYEHRIIWEILMGPIAEGMEIDHIDHNGINNDINNLRLVSNMDNCKNKPALKNNTSGHIGVSKSGKKWRAYIGKNDKQIFLGSFDSVELAAKARKDAEIRFSYHKNHGAAQ